MSKIGEDIAKYLPRMTVSPTPNYGGNVMHGVVMLVLSVVYMLLMLVCMIPLLITLPATVAHDLYSAEIAATDPRSFSMFTPLVTLILLAGQAALVYLIYEVVRLVIVTFS